ncbi:hypothetical protein THAOC_10904, partial [Thalassiosira oceanica]
RDAGQPGRGGIGRRGYDMHVRVEQEGRRRAESGRQRPELHAPAQGHGDAGRDERRAESRESVRAHREVSRVGGGTAREVCGGRTAGFVRGTDCPF